MTPPDPISEEVIKMEPGRTSDRTVEVDPVIPEPEAKALRYMAASAINHRKATVIVSQRLSGRVLTDMLYELRYKLPDNFKKKYQLERFGWN